MRTVILRKGSQVKGLNLDVDPVVLRPVDNADVTNSVIPVEFSKPRTNMIFTLKKIDP